MNNYSVECFMCGEDVHFRAKTEDLIAWDNGQVIQKAMPYLDTEMRETLITNMCEDCRGDL